jgi:hypothetical protein
MYVPPPASTVSLMPGSSCAAHRGCWKLFHETPTVQAAALGATLAGASLAGASLAALGALEAPPPLQAANAIAAVATSAANRR